MSVYQIKTVNNRPIDPIDAGVWGSIIFDPDDSKPNYIGLHLDTLASAGVDGWKIYSFSYSGNNVQDIYMAYGIWNDRATYFP